MLDIKIAKQDIVEDVFLVYFSSSTGNTHRFIKKMGFKNARLPISLKNKIKIQRNYVIVVPTYSGGGDQVEGAVPKQVIAFLNDETNRSYCRGVIATGNTNFGDTYCLAGPVISKKLNIPFLYKLEISGVQKNVTEAKALLIKFWKNKQWRNNKKSLNKNKEKKC